MLIRLKILCGTNLTICFPNVFLMFLLIFLQSFQNKTLFKLYVNFELILLIIIYGIVPEWFKGAGRNPVIRWFESNRYLQFLQSLFSGCDFMFSKPNAGWCILDYEKQFYLSYLTDVSLDVLGSLLAYIRDHQPQIVLFDTEGREDVYMIIKENCLYFIYEDEDGIHRTSDINVKEAAKQICMEFEENLNEWTMWDVDEQTPEDIIVDRKNEIKKKINEVRSYIGELKYLTTYEHGVPDCAYECPDINKDCVSCQYFQLILEKLAQYEHGNPKKNNI